MQFEINILYPSAEERQMKYLKGLSFDSEFVSVVPRIGRGARPSEASVDLSSLEAKMNELQECQKSIVASMSEMRTTFAANFAAVLSAIQSFRASDRATADIGVGGDAESSSDVSILKSFWFCVYICIVFSFF